MRAGRCVLVIAAVTLAGLLFWVAVGIGVYRHSTHAAAAPAQEQCSGRVGTTCTDVPLPKIEKVSHLDLPAGTEVLDSTYQEFQDWHLSATVRLPAGAADPLTAPGARPYYADAEGPGPDGAYYSAKQRTDADGRRVLELKIFTT